MTIHGSLTVGGVAPGRADVLALDSGFEVVAQAGVDAHGAFRLSTGDGARARFVLARFRGPIFGARLLAVDDATGRLDVNVGFDQAVTLTAEIVWPSHPALDWLDVHITPRRLEGVPSDAALALLRTGVAPGIVGVYATRRVSRPPAPDADAGLVPTLHDVAFTLLPGCWDLRVDHFVMRSFGTAQPPNWRMARCVGDRGEAVPERFGGFELDVVRDTAVRCELGQVDESGALRTGGGPGGAG